MKTKRLQTVFSVFFAYFNLSAFVRRSKSLIYACLLTQTSALYLPSQMFRTFSGITDKAPSIQWRDRAGLSPASILTPDSSVAYRGGGLPKEHKRLYVLFPKSSIARCPELGKGYFKACGFPQAWQCFFIDPPF